MACFAVVPILYVMLFSLGHISSNAIKGLKNSKLVIQRPNWHRSFAEQHRNFLARYGKLQVPSQHGKKFRSLVCAVSRNEWYILEFVIRHLSLGFTHVVIYDNNRVALGMDHDMHNLLLPFVKAKLVTVKPVGQRDDGLVPNTVVNRRKALCLKEYGHLADWVFLADSDEILYADYPGKRPNVDNVLNAVLDTAEEHGVHAFNIPWSMMYDEQKTSVAQERFTLLDSYPRYDAGIEKEVKVLAMLDRCSFANVPHVIQCKGGKVSSLIGARFRPAEMTGFGITLGLAHYYSRSIEWWLNKRDQSVPPYWNYMTKRSNNNCQILEFPYTSEYKAAIRQQMLQVRRFAANGNRELLRGQPLRRLVPILINNIDDATADIFRTKIEEGLVFDPQVYRKLVPNIVDYCDELHHFLSVGLPKSLIQPDVVFRYLA